jgi:hypothetical protein
MGGRRLHHQRVLPARVRCLPRQRGIWSTLS